MNSQASCPETLSSPIIAVVIPCFAVRGQVLSVLERVGPEVSRIFVVDDACPQRTGAHVQSSCKDPRVEVIFHPENQGVGGAVITGYAAALRHGADIVVKIDGDAQMAPELLPLFVQPLLDGEADYSKGNRFFSLENLKGMPPVRLLGNAGLSLLTKLSTGYWTIFDPTNGYTAIHAQALSRLPLEKIARRYFFETDMLFRLNTLRAVVVDVPMEAVYADEQSSLKISRVLFEFSWKHAQNFIKRIFYNYYLRDMSLASLELPLGLLLLMGGAFFGLRAWSVSAELGVATPAGTVMLAALPILLGVQFILAFIGFDVSNVPKRPLQRALGRRRARPL
jgi:glycosyltransferase involved in cell wall biosynthesis